MSKITMKENGQSLERLDYLLREIVLDNINEGIMVTNKYNEILFVNKQFEKITGYKFEEVQGKTPKALQSGIQELSFYEEMKEVVKKTGRWTGELWNRTKSGEVYLQALTIITVKDEYGQIENFIGIFSNAFYDDQENRRRKLEDYYDPLTTLPNRFLFEKHVDSLIRRSKETGEGFTLVYFRFKDFSRLNERHGYRVGDDLLKKSAMRMKDYFPENSVVTRWSGTEFTFILERSKTESEIVKELCDLHDKLSLPVYIQGNDIQLEACYGMSQFNKDGDELSTLLSKARTAMLEAKSEGKPYKFYRSRMGSPKDVFIVESELEQAIEEEQFELFYQPLVSVNSKKLIGFEALVRWFHPTKGLIPPIKFIPIAEQTKLIIDIGNIVFQKACEQLKEWERQGINDLIMTVNLSMNQFKNDFLVPTFKNVLKETGVPAQKIGLELTESSLIDDLEETTFKLHQLKKLGFHIAVDDFGTGYSSLGYLIDFPIDRIKIDRTFTQLLESNSKVKTIVSAITMMAETMGIEVVAEGVETAAQLELISQLNCNVAQGYYFDRPLPADEIAEKWFH